MKSIISNFERYELERLKALLPSKFRLQVAIIRASKVNPTIITTEKVGESRFAIQIDLIYWQQLSNNQRDLLFWHEVSRIQNKTVIGSSWETVVMGTGLFASLIGVGSQNILSLSVALVVTGLAGYQLYQRNRGERSLREATAADQNAINLATQFGYSFSQAYSSLHDALTTLSKQTSQKSLWRKYQVRLRVLSILAAKRKNCLQLSPSKRKVFSLPSAAYETEACGEL